MRKVVLVFTGLLISCFNIYSQVHIKEKVEIKPSSIAPLSSTSLASTGTFQMTLTGGPSTIQIGGSTYSNENGLDITVPNVSGYYAYHVTPGKIVDGVKVPGSYSIKAYFCGYVIMDNSGTAYDVFGSGYALCDDPNLTFFRDFDFTGPNGVSVYTDHNRCEGGDLWSGGYIGESIASPNAEYVNYETLQPAGNGISYEYEGDYRYTIISKIPYDAQPEQTTISSTVMGVTKSLPYELIPQSRFSIQGETLTYQDLLNFTLEPQISFMSVIKANLRIISGGEYASLLSTETWEIAGDNVEVYSDNLNEYILVMDNNPDDSVSVVVEYETTGNIQRDTVKIMPFLNVSVEPPIIAPGDTADVIIKTWNTYENNYVRIPGWYQCEIGIIDNCGNGLLLLPDGTSGEFFTEVSGTNIKFVASDSTGSDSISIKLRAGVLEGGGGAAKALTSQETITLKEKNSLSGNKNTSKDSLYACLDKAIKDSFRKTPASVTSCTPAEFNSVILATSEVAVANIFKPWEAKIELKILENKNEEVYLGTYSQFNENGKEEKIDLTGNIHNYIVTKCTTFHSPDGQITPVLMGFFEPLYKCPFSDFSITSIKTNDNEYHYRLHGNTFYFKVIIGYCFDCMNSKLLNRPEDVDNLTYDELIQALVQVEKQYIYGKAENYLVTSAIRYHEEQHKSDFEKDMQLSLQENIDPHLSSKFNTSEMPYANSFSFYKTNNSNTEKAKSDYWTILYYLSQNIKKVHLNRISNENYEQETQNIKKIRNELDEYIQRIKNRLKIN